MAGVSKDVARDQYVHVAIGFHRVPWVWKTLCRGIKVLKTTAIRPSASTDNDHIHKAALGNLCRPRQNIQKLQNRNDASEPDTKVLFEW